MRSSSEAMQSRCRRVLYPRNKLKAHERKLHQRSRYPRKQSRILGCIFLKKKSWWWKKQVGLKAMKNWCKDWQILRKSLDRRQTWIILVKWQLWSWLMRTQDSTKWAPQSLEMASWKQHTQLQRQMPRSCELALDKTLTSITLIRVKRFFAKDALHRVGSWIWQVTQMSRIQLLVWQVRS